MCPSAGACVGCVWVFGCWCDWCCWLVLWGGIGVAMGYLGPCV
jgi:hypothetical protein